MKTIARIATATTAAIASVLATLFVAAPALASEGEKWDPRTEFSTAGEPLQIVAILICGAILLAIVLLLAQLIGRAFDRTGN